MWGFIVVILVRMYKVYILFSVTKDPYYLHDALPILMERIRKHNSNHKGFTGKTGDWKLVYHELFQTKTDAMKKEMEIKKWKSRNLIERFIGLEHPDQ